MKRFFLIAAILLCSTLGNSEEIKFSVDCVILDQVLLEVKDGKSERFKGYSEGSVAGDIISFHFRYGSEKSGAYTININHDQEGVFFIPTKFSNANFSGMSDEWVVLENFLGKIVLKHDLINFDTSFMQFVGSRYHENNWSFIANSGSGGKIFAQTLNCMSLSAFYHDMVNEIFEFHKNK